MEKVLEVCAACIARLAPFGACCIKRQIKFTWNGRREVHALFGSFGWAKQKRYRLIVVSLKW
jgi:hypothetical protein